jgi:ParB/RepB/Spo0J family partition protein
MTEQFKYVLSDQIEVIDQFNPRKEENYDVENLYESIKQQNILTPILVMESSKTLEDGRPVYKLFEGHRRFKTLSIIESEEKNQRQIPVRIFEKMTEDELLMKALMLGVTGKQLKTSEKARAIAKLYSFGYDNKKIADMMQITQANISILKKFEKIPVSIQQKIDSELISFSETVKLMEQVSSVKTLEKIINQAIENKGGNKVYSRDIKELVTTSNDEEIKNVQNNITKDIKAKNVVDNYDDYPTFDLNDEVREPSQTIAEGAVNEPIENNELSLDEAKQLLGIKPSKNNTKPKTSSLMKIYDYLTDEKLKNVLNPNPDKIEILKAIMDYQDGLMSMDNLCDYFLDEK